MEYMMYSIKFIVMTPNSVLNSANEIHSIVKEGHDLVINEDVSLDGEQQKKDQSFKNGVMTAILDCHFMSKS